MGTIKTTNIEPIADNGTVTLGSSGDQFTLATGAKSSFLYPAFEAYLSADQSITEGVATKIQFNIENLDTDNCYDNSTNYRFTPNVAGKYLIGGAVNANTSTDFDAFIVAIFKNGTQVNRVINSNRHFDTAMTSFIVTANGTSDYFDIRGYTEQSGGSTLQATDSSSRLMWFCATKIIGV